MKEAAKNKVSVFEHQLEQYKTDLKTEEDPDKRKEISRYIRNLEAIIKRIKK